MTHPRRDHVRSDAPIVRRRHLPRILTSTLGLLLLTAAALTVLALSHRGVLPGVVVAGVEAGGMSQEELAAELEPIVAKAAKAPVRLHHEDTTYDVRPTDVGFEPSTADTVAAGWAVGRSGNPFERGWAHLASLWRTVEVPIHGAYDATALEGAVDQLETAVSTPAFPGDVEADPETLEVTTIEPARGFEVQREVLVQDLRAAFGRPGAETLEVPGTFVDPPTTMADVELVAAQASIALEAPFTASIAVIDEVVELAPADVAPLLGAEFVEGEGLRLSIDPELVADAFGERVDLFDVAPRDARWDIPREPAHTLDAKGDVTWRPEPVDAEVIPSKKGRAFDGDVVATQMAAVLADGGHDAEFDLPLVDAEFTTEEAEAFGITELLGTFTTYHAPGEPRVTNIQFLADVIDGTRVEPGEQFSINQLSGERTCDKGYVEDAMILNHQMVDVCGGGVSQFGTTMMNAAFFAGLPIDQYQAHSHYISRYPMGREATLNYPSPDIDVRWTNDTGKGVYIRTSYTDTSITVSLYGTTDVVAVTARHSAPFRPRPAPVDHVEDKTLAPGESRVVESGIDGFDVEFFRTIERADGSTSEEDFFTRYVAVPTVIHRNTSEPKPDPPAEDDGKEQPDGKKADEEEDSGTPEKKNPDETPSEG